jgi:2'-5' RNA ligase
MQQSIRAFIAFEIPPLVISRLHIVQQDVERSKIRARWVRPENIHLTLKFLGDIRPDYIDKIHTAMDGVAIEFSPITVVVKGGGVFPGIKRPRVIWAGLGGNIRSLLAFQSRLSEKLAEIQFPIDKRSFQAHLTLGRIKQAANPALIRQMIADLAKLDSDEFTFSQVFLFKSDLRPSGAVYSKLKQSKLEMTNFE